MRARGAALYVFLASFSLFSQTSPAQPQTAGRRELQDRKPDFDEMVRRQAETDSAWRAASQGHMQMEKITYRSKVGDLDIPAFVFQPLHLRGAKGHPAIVWV